MDAPSSARAALVFVSSGNQVLAGAVAIDGGGVSLPAAPSDSDWITVLFFSETLEGLGVSAAPLRFVAADDVSARPIPAADLGVLQARFSSGALEPWMELPGAPPEVARLRLPPLDLTLCVDRGGCIDPGRPDICKLPCGSRASPQDPDEPEPPLAPRMLPCPVGWLEAQTEPAECVPPADAVLAACPADQAPFSTGCARIGTCPEGEWNDELPGDRPLRFIRAGVAPGGDGSRTSPFGTLSDALRGAPRGSTIVLGKGVFVGQGRLDEVDLVGACAAETSIEAPAGTETVLEIAGAVEVRDLRIAGGGLAVDVRNGSVSLIRSMIEGADQAITIDGGELSADTIFVRTSTGIKAFGGARVSLRDAAITRGGGWALHLQGSGTRAVVDGLAVRSADEARSLSSAVVVTGGAELSLERALIDGRGAASGVVAVASRLVARDLFVRDAAGPGISLSSSTSTLARTVVERCLEHAAFITGGSSLTIGDAILRETSASIPRSRHAEGRAFTVMERGHLSAERILARANRGEAIRVSEGTTATLRDVDLQDTSPASVFGGEGLHVQRSAFAFVERLRVEGSVAHGIRVDGTLTATDLIVRNVLPEPGNSDTGHGLMVIGNAEVDRARFDDVNLQCLRVPPRGFLRASNVRARRCKEGVYLYADLDRVEGLPGGEIILDRAAIEDFVLAGVLISKGGSAEISSIRIGPRPEDGPSGSPRQTVAIWARGSMEHARMRVSDFTISSAAIGVHVGDGEVDLSRGIIAHTRTPIICLTAGHDPKRLLDGVEITPNAGTISCGVAR